MQTSTTTATRGRLPVARRDRRPALAALAVLLILLGALGSALIAFRSGDRTAVLVAAHDIPLGSVITAEDLTTAQVSADSGSVIEDTYEARFVGTRAIGSIPKGTLVNARMFRDGSIVPDGAALVGVVVDATRRTADVPAIGDVVRVVYVNNSASSGSTQGYTAGESVVTAARVLDVGAAGSSDVSNVTLLIKSDMAGKVADLAASGNLALVVLPADTAPVVDTVKG